MTLPAKARWTVVRGFRRDEETLYIYADGQSEEECIEKLVSASLWFGGPPPDWKDIGTEVFVSPAVNP